MRFPLLLLFAVQKNDHAVKQKHKTTFHVAASFLPETFLLEMFLRYRPYRVNRCRGQRFQRTLAPTFLFHSFTKRLQHQGKSSGCSCCFLCVQLGSTCDGIRSCVFCLVDIERRHSRHCAAVRIAVSSMHFWLLWFLVSHVFS